MNIDPDQIKRLVEENRQLRRRHEQLEALLNQIVGQAGGNLAADGEFSTLLDVLPVGVYIYQEDVLRYANRTAFELTGLDPDKDDPNRILSYVPPEYRRTIAQVAQARKEGLPVNDPYPVKLITATGETRWILIRGRIIRHGGAPATLGVAVDFTSHKHAGDVVEASQANLRAILENTEDYILLSDRKGNPVYFNSAYARIMKEVLGIDVKPGIKPHSYLPDAAARQVWEGYHRRVLSGERFLIEYSIRDASGKDRHLEVSYYPIVEHGEVTGFCEFTHEVTGAREARVRLDRARREQTEQLRRIAGGIGHEVHNSLFPLSASLYLIKQFFQELKHEKADYYLDLVETMEQSLGRSIDLTDSVVKLSRLDNFDKVSSRLKDALLETLDHNRERIEQMQVQVEVNVPEKLSVNCPSLYLSQVLQNLLVNALDAIESAPVRKLAAKATADREYVKLRLWDSGSGITPENQEKIFDPFFTTKSGEGSGIGLSIVKRVIDLCGGSIAVESPPGSGTTMIVELPRGLAD